MPPPVISVERLSKRYLVGHRAERGGSSTYTALRDVMGRELRNAVRKAADVVRGRQVVQGDAVEEFWALNDVSFEVQEGEVLGIIGRNGAGKSTLLKILSRITEPTAGRVTLRGRVASLLEVGTGFHPELTGRENIYLNGAILGMSRAEIRQKFDEIVAFAEVDKFLDTPVKRYSSGMYVRLAFAVAAHLESEILIVDEVLAVGDAEFQKKCLGKMDKVSRRDGRTVLVVSHNMGLVTSLCRGALWLDRGVMREQGTAKHVVGRYLARSAQGQDQLVRLDDRERPSFVRDDRLRCVALEWLSPLPLRHGEPVRVRLHFKIDAPVSDVSAIIGFNSIEGTRILTYHMDGGKASRRDFVCPGEYSVDLGIDAMILGPHHYSLDVGFRSGNIHLLDFIRDWTQLEVIAGPETPAEIAHAAPHASTGVRLVGRWSWEEQPRELDVMASGPQDLREAAVA
jgi:lipopolysaccharide transport system ATP-binding protein